MSSKCSPGMLATRQKCIDHAKQSLIDAFKTASKRAIQKAAEATGDIIGNKIANKITNVSKHSQKNNSWIVTNARDKEIPEERYTSLEKDKNLLMI